MYKYILITIFFFKIGFASNFSLDQFEIEINSNFLGKEVVLLEIKIKTVMLSSFSKERIKKLN